MSDMPERAGLARPGVTEADARAIALERYGIEATASELGSNQDRNFLLRHADGGAFVLRVDNPVFSDSARSAQHAAIDACRAAGIVAPAVLAGRDGSLTQEWGGHIARVSEFLSGGSFVEHGYLAPVVLEEFGALAGAVVGALASLEHPGLDRAHMWDMRVAHAEIDRLLPSIADPELRERVRRASDAAHAAVLPDAPHLPVQAIHGDITDDNVIGRVGDDTRLHPHALIDFGDLSLGWRVAEIAVTVTSMLHHEPDRPIRTMHAVRAFAHTLDAAGARLVEAEVRALWPLVVLRAALLVASGHRQLEIDGDNEYARERVAGEQAMFDSATLFPLAEMTEQVGALLDRETAEAPSVGALHAAGSAHGSPLAGLLSPGRSRVATIDPGVESADLASGRWLAADAEDTLVSEALAAGAEIAVLPYGVFRLTRTDIDQPDASATYPLDVEIAVRDSHALSVTAPTRGTVVAVGPHDLGLRLDQTAWVLELSGLRPDAAIGECIEPGDRLGSIIDPQGTRPARLALGLRRADAPEIPWGNPGEARLVAPERVPALSRLRPDPSTLVGLEPTGQRDESTGELARRERIFASAQERYYERPMQIERGWRHHLVDTTGRAYIDIVNNVTGLGHGHPGVADALDRQSRLLGTNSRFLYRGLAEYSERLLDLLPEGSGLDTVLLVNSGSEAVDLSLRLAQAATGRSTIVSLREAYHGWTMASDAVTTSAYDNPHALESRPDWVHVADVPNSYRGTHRGPASGPAYAADLGADLERLAADGRPVAGFICESVLGNAGGVLLPEGYLPDVYERVRRAGGLTIADEVQVGFGRMGSTFWGFEQSGVLPDIIALAKPMGNGFPIGGVITSKRVADALAAQGQFFASTGGNPVSCQVGIAVLDAMRDEGLQENARIIGGHLSAGFQRLALRHEIIGPIHGEGLYLGVELVRDRDTLEPATAEAAAICERMRELGVIVLTTSERSNVLKVKPPLCLTRESADAVLDALDRVLTEGW